MSVKFSPYPLNSQHESAGSNRGSLHEMVRISVLTQYPLSQYPKSTVLRGVKNVALLLRGRARAVSPRPALPPTRLTHFLNRKSPQLRT